MNQPIIKAFVLCNLITDSPEESNQKDLQGAGLSRIPAGAAFPVKKTFWVYIEIAEHGSMGAIQLALMRADSGRRLFFRTIPVQFENDLETTIIVIRLFECSFPANGVYFVELWYDGQWMIDQRLEVS
ncbi:MAG TPA: hypothetical protein VE988_02200 [Gemmataceae bacterium]|nr:hypothetical protein [Gemmataceae bacterium]